MSLALLGKRFWMELQRRKSSFKSKAEKTHFRGYSVCLSAWAQCMGVHVMWCEKATWKHTWNFSLILIARIFLFLFFMFHEHFGKRKYFNTGVRDFKHSRKLAKVSVLPTLIVIKSHLHTWRQHYMRGMGRGKIVFRNIASVVSKDLGKNYLHEKESRHLTKKRTNDYHKSITNKVQVLLSNTIFT